MNIRKAINKDIEKCVKIASSLSDWFDDHDVEMIKNALESYDVYVYDDLSIKGFMCLERKSDNVIEIKYIGVCEEFQHEGIGGSMLMFIEDYCFGKIDGYIEVKTLDSAINYEPYAKTRNFYEKKGFVQIESIKPYPGWNNNCPCAIYVKYVIS